MATAKQLKLLVKSFYDNDREKFKTIALQIAAHESRKGNSQYAKDLRDLVQSSSTQLKRINSLNEDNSDFFGFSLPNVSLGDMIAPKLLKDRIKKILLEFKERDKLANFNLQNRRKILLVGPPGTGKTLTASIIASELRLPLYTVQMHNLVTKYMGETSSKLKRIFDSISSIQGVYFFDEFDAIGSDRNSESDVGEMRRVLNSFLQFIEQDTSNSIILAATNNPRLLDNALFRRFDDVLNFSLPTKEEIKHMYSNKLLDDIKKISDSINEIVKESDTLSHAEITRICEDVLKDKILLNNIITKDLLMQIIKQRKEIYNK